MMLRDRGVLATYNGEIYSCPELYEELAALSHVFWRTCDIEVLLYAYLQWGGLPETL